MTVNYEKKHIPITLKVADSTRRELDAICEEHDRTLSYVAREMLLRGLTAYRADGRLKDVVPNARPLAPVVAHIGPADAAAAADTAIDEVRRMIGAEEIAELDKRLRPRRSQTVGVLRQKAK